MKMVNVIVLYHTDGVQVVVSAVCNCSSVKTLHMRTSCGGRQWRWCEVSGH